MSEHGQPAALSLRHASFGYGARPVAKDLTLQVWPGEVVALLGPNGSGKSTLVKGMLGLNDVLGGQVEVFGAPLDRHTARTRIGYVPQRHTLSASVHGTVREVVATGRLALRPWWRRSGPGDVRQVDQALELTGLTERAGTDVATLSGGQQRRVLIARALSAAPDMLVMDEPTAGVDAANQDALVVVLRRLAASGVTMLVVTHEVVALRGLLSRVVALENGRICFDGSPDDYSTHRLDPGHRHDDAVAGHHHHLDHEVSERPGLLAGGPLAGGPLDRPHPGEAHHG